MIQPNTITCGDSLELMKQVPDKSVDLVWFSPPYWNLHKYTDSNKEIGYGQSLETYLESLGSIQKESIRVLKDSGNLVINIMDVVRKNEPIFLSDELIKRFDMVLIERIVWSIRNKMPVASNVRFVNKMEWILHFAKDRENYYFNKDAVREPHSHYAAKDRRKWKWNANGKCPGNVWDIPAYRVTGKNKFHVAGFPIQLCDRVISCWCPENGTVLDPFNGGGTTTLSAVRHNRQYIGFDLDQKCCDIAEHRIKNKDATK
jgi:adenine-specific DNA-methyltransferase